jgi:hypothetical protein
MQLNSAEHALKTVTKVSSVVPFYGAGSTGLRKFIQNQIPLLKFNSPSLTTEFRNAQEKEAQPILKVERMFLSAQQVMIKFSSPPLFVWFVFIQVPARLLSWMSRA